MLIGPILGTHGHQSRSVVAVLESLPPGVAPTLHWKPAGEASRPVVGEILGEFEVGRSQVWKFAFDLDGVADGPVEYEVHANGGAQAGSWRGAPSAFVFHHKGSSEGMKVLFGSCVDLELDAEDRADREGYGAFLHELPSRTGGPVHLLLLGGDQVYTDKFLPCTARRMGGARAEAVAAGLREAYRHGWTERPAFAELLASVPSAMMWDDHDIIDGYGSYLTLGGKVQTWVESKVFPEAARLFDMLQLRRRPALPAEVSRNRSWVLRQDSSVFAALDARSERDARVRRVVPEASLKAWEDAIAAEIEVLPPGEASVYLVVPIPLLHLRYDAWMPNVVRYVPYVGDDIVDNWSSSYNLQEESKLAAVVSRLRRRCRRLVLLSGDSHMASAGLMRVRDGDRELDVPQITSSGLENQSSLAKRALITGPGGEVPGNGIKHLIPFRKRTDRWFTFPGSQDRYRLIPVDREARGFLPDAPHPFRDKDFFHEKRNAVLLRLGAAATARWIFEVPSEEPRTAWAL